MWVGCNHNPRTMHPTPNPCLAKPTPYLTLSVGRAPHPEHQDTWYSGWWLVAGVWVWWHHLHPVLQTLNRTSHTQLDGRSILDNKDAKFIPQTEAELKALKVFACEDCGCVLPTSYCTFWVIPQTEADLKALKVFACEDCGCVLPDLPTSTSYCRFRASAEFTSGWGIERNGKMSLGLLVKVFACEDCGHLHPTPYLLG